MENLDKRIQATLIIWVAVAATLGMSGMGDASNFSDEIITIVLAGAAFLSTTAIWFLGRDSAVSNKIAPSETEKAKNDSTREDARVRLLLDLMDDDQKAALRQQLMDDLNSDGESVSLSDLLADEPQRRHR